MSVKVFFFFILCIKRHKLRIYSLQGTYSTSRSSAWLFIIYFSLRKASATLLENGVSHMHTQTIMEWILFFVVVFFSYLAVSQETEINAAVWEPLQTRTAPNRPQFSSARLRYCLWCRDLSVWVTDRRDGSDASRPRLYPRYRNKQMTPAVPTSASVRAPWSRFRVQKVSVNQCPSALFDSRSETGSLSCRSGVGGVRVTVGLPTLGNQNGVIVWR